MEILVVALVLLGLSYWRALISMRNDFFVEGKQHLLVTVHEKMVGGSIVFYDEGRVVEHYSTS